MKACTKCKETKALTAYENRNAGKSKSSRCKSCIKEKRKEHAAKHKVASAAWYQANKEKCKKQHNEYYHQHKEHLDKKAKEWYENNKEYILKREKQYYLKNRERILERSRNYKKANPEKVADSRVKSATNRRVYRRAKDAQRVLDLPDWYVKKNLLGFKKNIAVPQQLIEARRLLHQINRSIKNENSNAIT